jgi:hypothetical protein
MPAPPRHEWNLSLASPINAIVIKVVQVPNHPSPGISDGSIHLSVASTDMAPFFIIGRTCLVAEHIPDQVHQWTNSNRRIERRLRRIHDHDWSDDLSRGTFVEIAGTFGIRCLPSIESEEAQTNPQGWRVQALHTEMAGLLEEAGNRREEVMCTEASVFRYV